MPKLSARIKSNGVPDIVVAGKVETVKDLPRFFNSVSKQTKAVMRFFPEAAAHKVVSVSVKSE